MPLDGLALGDQTDRDTFLVVQGPSPYVRYDLGARLMVLVVPRADLPDVSVSIPEVTLTTLGA